jgi:signal transduction histidine kinase
MLGSHLLVILGIFIALFLLLDRAWYNTQIKRIDSDLESEILRITAYLHDEEVSFIEAVDNGLLTRNSLAKGISQTFYRAYEANGTLMGTSDLQFWDRLQTLVPPDLQSQPLQVVSANIREHGALVVYYRFPNGEVLQIGRDLSDIYALVAHSRQMMATAMAFVLLLGGLASWYLTVRGLRGIRLVSHTAALIREQAALNTRVPEQTGALETDQLARSFNQMLDHIQTLMKNLRYVTDSVAHDIKTPVTRMRGIAETEIRKNQHLELAGTIVEECDHILNLVQTLLNITAAETGLYQWELEDIDLAELLREGCELFEPVLEDAELSLQAHIPHSHHVKSDGRVLQRVIANLLDNAIKYSHAGGTISVNLGTNNAKSTIRVTNQGIGIPAQDLPSIFDRFYRCDHSRSKPGNGLGLSFCKATIEGLGGQIQCESQPNRETTFTVTL